MPRDGTGKAVVRIDAERSAGWFNDSARELRALQAAMRRADHGEATAYEELDQITERLCSLTREICGRNARSLEQLNVKAAFVLEHLHDPSDIVQALALSICRDMAAITETRTRP